jgi:hypothetical protein
VLGRLQMTVDQAIESYTELSKTVFGKKFGWIRFLRGKPRYPASALEAAIKTTLRKVGLAEDSLMVDTANISTGQTCRTAVVSNYTNSAGGAVYKVFRSYDIAGRDSADSCTVVEAARATTAAPTYFAPVKVALRTGEQPVTFSEWYAV